MKKLPPLTPWLMERATTVILIVVVVLVLSGGSGFWLWKLYQKIDALEGQITELTGILKTTEASLATTTSAMLQARAETDQLAEQVGGITSTVGTLQKLNQLDKELLRKYSKITFLNENYIPKNLTNIDAQYLYDKDKSQQIQADVWRKLQSLLSASTQAGINNNLQIISAYRSFGEQTTLKSGYKITYGAGANKFSADQGYSEHQLGTTVDFTNPELGADFSNFEESASYTWLSTNAYGYGFVLSYPQSNKYYQFEPWHWRYVGVELATRLHNENKYFYDLLQRDIDPYLIKIFD